MKASSPVSERLVLRFGRHRGLAHEVDQSGGDLTHTGQMQFPHRREVVENQPTGNTGFLTRPDRRSDCRVNPAAVPRRRCRAAAIAELPGESLVLFGRFDGFSTTAGPAFYPVV